ncbi:hypothetical protein IQ274_14040 [Nostoc sp. LEGE 12447]|nr:hypothetical protein [Nostoc sp. LEGE 12447]
MPSKIYKIIPHLFITAFTAVMRYSSSNWQTSFLNVEDLLNRVQLRLVCQPFLL